ncbi:hypothetical protein OEZ85_010302 [Tetradesmus obliquus]|uniref:Plastid lipid-associated protein/fibrillin conserved domain-containing protein n=1 Tax=Tetradesmus obliquus TaxID=3088 RepID=A0ABY8TM73_TETOB|nr:hypothetical protein OEZ85_010302 [Tetradesmus obliquus]
MISLRRSSGAGTAPGYCWSSRQQQTVNLSSRLQLPQRHITCRDGVAGPAAADIVSTILDKVQGTDGGISLQPEQKREVDALISQLEAAGRSQQPRPMQNPLLFGNYNVAYTSSGDDQRGQPAGGRFRGRLGRLLFQTTGVFQSVLQPDIATNKVTFKLFGVLPGAVGLRGTVVPVQAGQPHGRGTAGEGDTVRVLFEPPVLSLGSGLHFRIGPPSSVQLSTPYLDERVRLGRGSRGSLFVFTRGGAADKAGMDQVGIQPSTKSGVAWLTAALLGMLAGGWGLWSTGLLAARLLAGSVWLVAALLLAVLQQGGIVRDDDDIKRVQEMTRQQQQQQREAAAAAKAAAAQQAQTAAGQAEVTAASAAVSSAAAA